MRNFFHFFKILIFWIHRGIKGQKMGQNGKKLCLLCSISQEPHIIWLSFMVQMCKMVISPGVFFNVKILIFQTVKGLKGQKMTQNDKNVCLSTCIFQEPYIICPSFLVHMYLYKDKYKRAKNGPKWQEIMSVSLHISGTVHHILWFLVHV